MLTMDCMTLNDRHIVYITVVDEFAVRPKQRLHTRLICCCIMLVNRIEHSDEKKKLHGVAANQPKLIAGRTVLRNGLI